MQRLARRKAVLIVAVLVCLAGLVPVSTATAAATTGSPQEPAAAAGRHSQVVTITSGTGQIRVDDPLVPSGVKPISWTSPDYGWSKVAVGDFNGDGDMEILAAKYDTSLGAGVVKIFDPVQQSGVPLVGFGQVLASGQQVNQLAVGDFDGDGRAEFAYSFSVNESVNKERVRVYDGGTGATSGEWTLRYEEGFASVWQTLVAGDINRDGYADLAMLRNVDQRLQVLTFVNNWSPATLFDQANYVANWETAAIGDVFAGSTDNAGNEIVLSRDAPSSGYNSLLVFHFNTSGGMDDRTPSNYYFYPYFTSLALSDQDHDANGDKEIFALRDPRSSTGSFLALFNPSGPGMGYDFHAEGACSTYCGASGPYQVVRAGDLNGDGWDEVVVLRGDSYRVYRQPRNNSSDFLDVTTGGPFVNNTLAVGNIGGVDLTQGPTLAASPTSVAFGTVNFGDKPTRQISVVNNGTGGTIHWQAAVVSGSAWLQINKTSGTTPGTLNITVDSTKTTLDQTNTGAVRLTTSDPGVLITQVEVPVTVKVLNPGFSVTPARLSITQLMSGKIVSQTVTIASPGSSVPVTWVATVIPADYWPTVVAQMERSQATNAPFSTQDIPPVPWLHLNRTDGTTNDRLVVSIDPAVAGYGMHRALIVVVGPPTLKNRLQGVEVFAMVPTHQVLLPLTRR